MVLAKQRSDVIWNRYNFPISMEGCVLYLPLWQEDMQIVSPLRSYDRTRFSATVTGAVFTPPLGRNFDGDDKIVTSDAIGISGASARTLEVWAKPTIGAWQDIVRWGFGATNLLDYGIAIDATGNFYFTGWGTGDFDTGFDVVDGTWNHFVCTYDGTNVYPFMNGVAGTASAQSLNTTNNPVYIGVFVDGATEWFTGLVGEARIYNRALSAGEVQRNYLLTKWRFS